MGAAGKGVDVMVLGAGAMGFPVAYQLAETTNLQVVVNDANRPMMGPGLATCRAPPLPSSPTPSPISSKVAPFNLNRVDVEIRNIDLSRLAPQGLPRIRTATGPNLVAMAMRQENRVIPLADTPRLGRQIGEPMGEQMYDPPSRWMRSAASGGRFRLRA